MLVEYLSPLLQPNKILLLRGIYLQNIRTDINSEDCVLHVVKLNVFLLIIIITV